MAGLGGGDAPLPPCDGPAAALQGGETGAAETMAVPDEAPFGDKVSPAITNYNRATPFVATSGALKPDAAAELKALGFKAVVDLRGPAEGVATAKFDLESTGLAFFNIPVVTGAPSPDQVRQFAAIVEDPGNYPLLVYCVTANRVGAMWALYRAAKGVAGEFAIEEGRALGLRENRESVVRKRLNLPPLTESQES